MSKKISEMTTVERLLVNKKKKDRHHSVDGLIQVIYSHQRASSRKRGYPEPNYSLVELRVWMKSQPMFDLLYNNWTDSKYDKSLSPSCDRLDDYKPYTLDNIQITTWLDNHKKSTEDTKNGTLNKRNHIVSQYTLEGIFIRDFHSKREASRITGSNQSDIGKVCSGIYKQINGFIYKNK